MVVTLVAVRFRGFGMVRSDLGKGKKIAGRRGSWEMYRGIGEQCASYRAVECGVHELFDFI